MPTEQIAAVPAANLDNLDILFDLTNTEHVPFRLPESGELNLQTMKSALTETDEPTRMAFSANDPQQLLAVSESVAAHWRAGTVKLTSTVRTSSSSASSRRAPARDACGGRTARLRPNCGKMPRLLA
ncbi:hypothetical protein [Cupriavidus sp. CuC1]|uniref:hypothetical protein n=1 Tax=Cupriavidus sp. CuC1 TaxID=3373131 RepID=UPI0037D3D192